MKLTGKTRLGPRVKKSYDAPQTPWRRLQNSGVLDEATQERMKQDYLKLNPAKLRRDLYALEIALSRFTAPESPDSAQAATPAMRNVTLQGGDANDQNA